jgi:hypothetical protein
VTRRILVPVVADRDARENIDNECDNAEDGREDHQCVYGLAEVDTKRSNVGRVAKDAEVEKQDGQFGRPDGEFVHYLGPPEPLLRLAIRSKRSLEGWYHKSSCQLLISESRHEGSVTIGSRFEKVREDVNEVAMVFDIPKQATALSKIENSFGGKALVEDMTLSAHRHTMATAMKPSS